MHLLKIYARQQNLHFDILRPLSKKTGNMYSSPSLANQIAHIFKC